MHADRGEGDHRRETEAKFGSVMYTMMRYYVSGNIISLSVLPVHSCSTRGDSKRRFIGWSGRCIFQACCGWLTCFRTKRHSFASKAPNKDSLTNLRHYRAGWPISPCFNVFDAAHIRKQRVALPRHDNKETRDKRQETRDKTITSSPAPITHHFSRKNNNTIFRHYHEWGFSGKTE